MFTVGALMHLLNRLGSKQTWREVFIAFVTSQRVNLRTFKDMLTFTRYVCIIGNIVKGNLDSQMTSVGVKHFHQGSRSAERHVT